MRRKHICLLLAVILCLALTPVIAHAWSSSGSCYIMIGGTEITNDNAADVFGDGKVVYDTSTKTLTLTDYTK